MKNFLYVDNSNVWIEGMYVSAVAQGMAPNLAFAHEHKRCDYSWKLDFGKLIQFAGSEKHEIGRAVLYGSRPPQNDSLCAAAKRNGFEVIVHDRNPSGEKKVDTNIVTDIITDSYERAKAKGDEIALVSGDADFVPTIDALGKRAFHVNVVFWSHASREIRDAATEFTALNTYLDHLKL
jgi:uncharacterized LabA/DUF88 family protein